MQNYPACKELILNQNISQGWANSSDLDQTLWDVVSNQGQHSLPLIQQFLDTTFSSKMEVFKFYDKYGKELSLHAMGRFGRWQTDDIFLIFPGK